MGVAIAPRPDRETALLRDGGQVLLRPYRPADRLGIRQLLERMTDESRALRFHGVVHRVSEDLLDRVVAGHAIVAEGREQLVGIGNYIPLRDPTTAESAFTVDDAQQGRGIGTQLFERLAADARKASIRSFIALVLATNRRMIDVLAHLGFQMSRHLDAGELEYVITLDTTPEAVNMAARRLRIYKAGRGRA